MSSQNDSHVEDAVEVESQDDADAVAVAVADQDVEDAEEDEEDESQDNRATILSNAGLEYFSRTRRRRQSANTTRVYYVRDTVNANGFAEDGFAEVDFVDNVPGFYIDNNFVPLFNENLN